MALTKSLEKFGTTFSDAYHRITNLNYSVYEYQEASLTEAEPDADGNPQMPIETVTWVSRKNANFQVSTYVDSSARDSHSQPVTTNHYEFTPDWDSSENILAQAYAYLKTLDEYDGAVDA